MRLSLYLLYFPETKGANHNVFVSHHCEVTMPYAIICFNHQRSHHCIACRGSHFSDNFWMLVSIFSLLRSIIPSFNSKAVDSCDGVMMDFIVFSFIVLPVLT